MRLGLRGNFLHQHMRDTVIILQVSKLHHPWCPCCDMLMPWTALNGRHPNTAQCDKGEKRKQSSLEAEEMQESTERSFQTYVWTLTLVSWFKYLD